jgi:hypothetical protein
MFKLYNKQALQIINITIFINTYSGFGSKAR